MFNSFSDLITTFVRFSDFCFMITNEMVVIRQIIFSVPKKKFRPGNVFGSWQEIRGAKGVSVLV